MNVPVDVVNLSRSLPLPKYETELAAGMDVMACFDCEQGVKGYDWFTREYQEYPIDINNSIGINPGERVLIPTGLKVGLPEGYEIQVRPRSGNAIKKGLTVLNTPGTIDADFRGIICVILINLSNEPIEINHGDKIAQIVLSEVPRIQWNPTNDLSKTDRGEGGFGSTGASNKESDKSAGSVIPITKDRIPSFQEGDRLDNVGLIKKVLVEGNSGQIIYDVEVDGEIIQMSEQEILNIVL